MHIPELCSLAPSDIQELVSAVVGARAFAKKSGPSLKLPIGSAMAQAAEKLAKADLLELGHQGDHVSVRFTRRAMELLVTSISFLRSPRPILKPRAGVELEGMTSYELIRRLLDEDWSWQLWVPPHRGKLRSVTSRGKLRSVTSRSATRLVMRRFG